jgi:hypothetical protein
MIESLQRVIAEIEKLPTDTQDAIANRLLDELEDEKPGAIALKLLQINSGIT